MATPTAKELMKYVTHCPSCGSIISWPQQPFHNGDMAVMSGTCSSKNCCKRWSFIVDIDPSGTFGVMGFSM